MYSIVKQINTWSSPSDANVYMYDTWNSLCENTSRVVVNIYTVKNLYIMLAKQAAFSACAPPASEIAFDTNSFTPAILYIAMPYALMKNNISIILLEKQDWLKLGW